MKETKSEVWFRRKIPVAGSFDVIVAGGGPAGVAAAIAAARRKCRVLLLEQNGCLGGIWTSGLMSLILDAQDKGGLLKEIMTELDRRGARGRYRDVYHPEAVKLLLQEFCAASGVSVRLYTRVIDCLAEDGILRMCITASPEGIRAFSGGIFIDCTGNGDLAAAAGCSFDLGAENEEIQPMSMIALVTGIHDRDLAEFNGTKGREEAKKALYREITTAGASCSYAKPTLFQLTDELFLLMSHHAYCRNPMDTAELTAATEQGRAEIAQQIEALRNSGRKCWRNLRLVSTSAMIGIREARRIHGLDAVTRSDVMSGRRRKDAVCRCRFCVDIHVADETATLNRGIAVTPYEIPLKALIAADAGNLLLGGRCISGDYYAHASYRVTGTAVRTGEAAGICAALSIRRGEPPFRMRFSKKAFN